MHARVVPPAPRLLDGERHDRREQPLHDVERGAQRHPRRRRSCVAMRPVGAALHELDVVVAEPPEERLGALERACVVEHVERRRGLGDEDVELGEHRLVDGVGRCDVAVDALDRREAEHELGDVEQLVGELAPDLHLILAERGVDPRSRRRRPVTDGIGAVLVEQAHRCDDVALRLRHLLAVGVEDPAGDRGVTPWRPAELEMTAHDRGEQPGADDVVRLRSHVHGEHAGEQVGILLPPAGDLGRQRRRRPRVEHVGVAHEPARPAALVGRVPVRHIGRRIDRQLRLVGHERFVVVGLAGVVEAVPDRDRHTEEALTADQPVAVEALDPVVVAVLHVRRVPGDLAAAFHERGAELRVAATVADVPLTTGDDLQRPAAAFVELHGVGDRARLAERFTGRRQLLDDLLLGLGDGQARRSRRTARPRRRAVGSAGSGRRAR